MESKDQSRRDFLKLSATGLAAITILPSKVVSGLGHQMPSDKLNIAVIGSGGIGFKNLTHMSSENIVAIADVDWSYAEKSFRRWTAANKYKDYRIMLEKESSIDAVLIAVPDHSHALAAMTSIQLQKHVYIQTPVAHSIFELRRITELAKVYGVTTQVGNQGASGDGTRVICELIWSGAIGEISKVDAYTPKPDWINNIDQESSSSRMPKDLNWDLFVGPSHETEYHSKFTPYLWRNYWQFSNGTIGTNGTHYLEPVFRALNLEFPRAVKASSDEFNFETITKANKITFWFSERNNLPKVAMPAVELNWYDGGMLPSLPPSQNSYELINAKEGGIIFYGTEGIIVADKYGENPKLIQNNSKFTPSTEHRIHRIEKPFEGGHEQDFIRACKESSYNKLATTANLDSQEALNETVLLGSLAIKLQSLNKTLLWNHNQMRFTNIDEYDELTIENNEGIYFDNGIPKSKKDYIKINALQYVDQAIRPIYRSGFKQDLTINFIFVEE